MESGIAMEAVATVKFFTTKAVGIVAATVITMTVEPATRVAGTPVAVIPRSGANEGTVYKPIRAIVAVGSAGVRIVGIVAIRASRCGTNRDRCADTNANADADLGILLRLTSYTSTGPAIVCELRDVSLAEPDDVAFRIGAPPGVRVIEDTGGLLDQVDAPEPVRAAVRAVNDIRRVAESGAAVVSGFLDALRDQRRPPPAS